MKPKDLIGLKLWDILTMNVPSYDQAKQLVNKKQEYTSIGGPKLLFAGELHQIETRLKPDVQTRHVGKYFFLHKTMQGENHAYTSSGSPFIHDIRQSWFETYYTAKDGYRPDG